MIHPSVIERISSKAGMDPALVIALLTALIQLLPFLPCFTPKPVVSADDVMDWFEAKDIIIGFKWIFKRRREDKFWKLAFDKAKQMEVDSPGVFADAALSEVGMMTREELREALAA